MDKIEEIVDRAIKYTEDILQRAPQHYQASLDGLRRMRDNLQFGADDHPALERLNAYLDELSRRFPN